MFLSSRSSILKLLLSFVIFTFIGATALWILKVIKKPELQKHHFAEAFEKISLADSLPQILEIPSLNKTVVLSYTLDSQLQESMFKLIKQYHPDYAAFVAIESKTGKILSLISYNPYHPEMKENLSLRATFPSASTFKLVTASAVLDENRMTAESKVSFNGRTHTLYKNHIFKEDHNRWTNFTTLKSAFAKSINTVFGKLGVFTVGPASLQLKAQLFGFNAKINSDLPIQEAKLKQTDEPWEIAEIASGYTRETTMSPLHGALMASVVENKGILMEPYIIEKAVLVSENNSVNQEPEYLAGPKIIHPVIEPKTADELKSLMRETVLNGTSRTSFRPFTKSKRYGVIEAGGKTGSLQGKDPEGKYDWFIGYGNYHGQSISLAALTISKEYWKVKSSYLARRALEFYFEDKLPPLPPKKGRRQK